MKVFKYIRSARIANVRKIIWALSIAVFLVVIALDRIEITAKLPFDPHLFALVNAFINGTVFVLLIAAYLGIRNEKRALHIRLMMLSICLSAMFLVFYVLHHIFTGSTSYGGEGLLRLLYFVLLISHILLAAVILPFILFTAYRGITEDYQKHKKIARYTFPLWLYVALSGVLVYIFISPYY